MRPLQALPPEEAKRLTGVLFDLDDTLLTDGVLTRQAYDALWDLRDSGLGLVAVTGRPAGWASVLVRQWPLGGIVAENGAVRFVRSPRGIECVDSCASEERSRRRAGLREIVAEVERRVPEACLADDVPMRVTDVAWDIAEHHSLPEARIASIVQVVKGAGARVTRSSVHLHASFETDDKASGALAFLRSRGEDPGRALFRWAFIGDSSNDAACFGAFFATFGVANVRPFVPRLAVPPRWVASQDKGAGFAEIARRLVTLRTRE